MLVLQSMPITGGLGAAMSPATARRVIETIRASLAAMLLVTPKAVLNFADDPLQPNTIVDLELEGFRVTDVTGSDVALFRSLNSAAETLVAAAAPITHISRGQAEARGLIPDVMSGSVVADVKQSVDALLDYWRASQGEKTFPWKTALGIFGLALAVGGGAFVIYRQTKRRR